MVRKKFHGCGGGGGRDLDHIVLDRYHGFLGTGPCAELMVVVCSDHRDRRP